VEREVIGVVKDAFTEDLNRIDPMFYQMFEGGLEPKLLVRKADSAALNQVAAIASSLDSRVRVQATSLSANFGGELAMSTRAGLLAGLLGSLALALASVGMFGVFAYVVQQRTREIGVRMALGARPADIIWLVLSGNSKPVVVGLLLGFGGAMAASRLLRHLLLGLSPFDPVTHAGVGVILALSGLVASYLPARRATKVDPMVALRCE
jgi:ABC-type antimicrobial peptide transport system permease subunit